MAVSSTLLNASGIRIGSGLGAAVYSSSTGAPTVTTSGSPSAGKACYAFNGAGSITFSTGGLIEVYMIGGGGSGGGGLGGGGGAGGVYYKSKVYVEADTSYTVVPGAGGTSVSEARARGGQASGIFAGTQPIAFIGGGGGGGYQNAIGQSGVCSGGGGGSSAGQAGEEVQPASVIAGLDSGFAGGKAASTPNYNGGGGGGIGGVGGNSTTTVSGAGGIGLASSITGTSVSRGGGGGGGGQYSPGGLASFGGGAGSASGTPTAGTANTGGGGGGAQTGVTGAAGGSGVVIILVG